MMIQGICFLVGFGAIALASAKLAGKYAALAYLAAVAFAVFV